MSTKALNGPVGPQIIRAYTGPAGLAGGIGVKQGAADGTCLAVTGAGQKCLGLVHGADLVGAGTYGVLVWGEGLGISGAALAADAEVMSDANGNLVPSTAQGDNVIGRTRSSATAANQEVVVFVSPYIR